MVSWIKGVGVDRVVAGALQHSMAARGVVGEPAALAFLHALPDRTAL